jgi:O-antigen ligase
MGREGRAAVQRKANEMPSAAALPRSDDDARGRSRSLASLSWPAVVVAFSLNGFFLYLAVLDLVDVGPTTRITAAYYALLCAALVATAWRGRKVLRARIHQPPRVLIVFVATSTLLAAWFLVNTALFSEGRLAYRLAGVLVLWTIPTAVAAASLRRQQLPEVGLAIAAIALVFVLIEVIALLRAGTHVFRFTPIADLDPISAGIIPALGAVAAMALRTPTIRTRIAQLVIVTVLVAAAVIPGSRGPVVTLVAAGVALALLRARRSAVVILACLAAGLAVGSVTGSHIGSFGYLTSDAVGGGTPLGNTHSTPDRPGQSISTFSIRRQWLEEALRATPEKPVFGHGVGMLVDDTPEARLMGVAGQRTYPHNTFVEAAYSLGIIGLAAYVGLLAAAVAALVSVLRSNRVDQVVHFTLGIAVFAFVNANISGEIGEDALLWSASAVAVALYAETRAARTASTK